MNRSLHGLLVQEFHKPIASRIPYPIMVRVKNPASQSPINHSHFFESEEFAFISDNPRQVLLFL